MDPNDESNQLGWHAVSSRMPIVIEDAFEPPPAHSRPRPAVQQHRSVRPLVQHGPPFENSENYREAELPRAPMLALPDCRHHLAAECDADFVSRPLVLVTLKLYVFFSYHSQWRNRSFQHFYWRAGSCPKLRLCDFAPYFRCYRYN
ncbi:hypothetical protein MRX96_031329 [Rhipicephalus microplus]